jgi:hypothetical protein
MFRLTDAQMRELLRQPETGMGYQEVEVTHRDNKSEKGIVYNAELLFEGNETQNDLKLLSYPALLRVAKSASDEIKSLRVLNRYETRRFLSATTVRKAATGPAKDAAVEKTKADEVFKRFSAFENDHRVTADKGLLPGSYATTDADAKNVKTGRDAVSRYALPNPDPASYVFTIKPTKDTEVQRGTVEAANGQNGGGVEVIFTSGATANTVTLPPDQIPD